MNKKLLTLIIAFVLVVAAGLVFYAAGRPDSDKARNGSSQDQDSGKQDDHGTSDEMGKTVTKTGTLGCLQPKGDGPHTMECAFGLTADDGRVYALRADDPTIFSGVGTNDQKIEVTGTLAAPEQTSKFDTAGTVRVTELKKL